MNRLIIILLLILAACTGKQVKDPPKDPIDKQLSYTLRFDADSAFSFVKAQVDMGPRVPGSIAHGMCATYLSERLGAYCDTSMVQNAVVQDAKGRSLEIKNIIGSFGPNKGKRILLCAHWDTRPQADEDPDRPDEPADGANDGASGVGVLLEVARQLQQQTPEWGVDIVFFDAEDMGSRNGGVNSWCLGSQQWAKHPHVEGYHAEYGILLDMVGAPDAVFLYEKHSLDFATWLVHHVWRNAASLGYKGMFRPFEGGYITDDHFFIMGELGIPTIDIIHYDLSNAHGFGDFWHTHKDNMEGIDPKTLKAVGETVLKTVWEAR